MKFAHFLCFFFFAIQTFGFRLYQNCRKSLLQIPKDMYQQQVVLRFGLFQPGEKVMVIPSLSDAEAVALFPNGVTTKAMPSGKSYLRYTQP